VSLLSAPRADEEDVETGEIGIGGIGEEGGHIEEGDEEHRSGMEKIAGFARRRRTTTGSKISSNGRKGSHTSGTLTGTGTGTGSGGCSGGRGSGDDLRGRARSKSTGEQGQSGKGQLDLKIRTVEVKGDVELPD